MKEFNLAYLVQEYPWSGKPYGRSFSFEPNFFIYAPEGDHKVDLLKIDKDQHSKAQFFYLLNTNPQLLAQKKFSSDENLPAIANFIKSAAGKHYDGVHNQFGPMATSCCTSESFISLSFEEMGAAIAMSDYITQGLFFMVQNRKLA